MTEYYASKMRAMNYTVLPRLYSLLPGNTTAIFPQIPTAAGKTGSPERGAGAKRLRGYPRRSGNAPVPVIAKPVRTPAVAIRLPVHPPVSRPSSKSGESNGGGAPLVVGEGFLRGPPRNRFPLAVSFASFFGGKERGPPEATGQGNEKQRQKANTQRPGKLPAAAGISLISRFAPAPPRGSPPLRRGLKTGKGREFSRCGATPFLLA